MLTKTGKVILTNAENQTIAFRDRVPSKGHSQLDDLVVREQPLPTTAINHFIQKSLAGTGRRLFEDAGQPRTNPRLFGTHEYFTRIGGVSFEDRGSGEGCKDWRVLGRECDNGYSLIRLLPSNRPSLAVSP